MSGFKSTTIPILLVFFLACSTAGLAQERMDGPIIVCPGGTEYHRHSIAPPSGILSAHSRTSSAKSRIVVDYVGFSEEAKTAFQYAADIWESLLISEVEIRIQATWEPLGEGVLGAAGAATYYRDFKNAPSPGIWYPVALAEKLAGEGLNREDEYDIVAYFNSEFKNWYTGTDGEGGNKYDLVTVVLHEIGHGLGFASSERYEDGVGNWDLSGTGYPVVYTTFIENVLGTNISKIKNDDVEMGNFLTSNNLFIGSELVIKNNGAHARIYAPNPYSQGSSISHWNESTYNNTDNALMTPQVAPGEALHHPGPLTLSLFADMGWFSTRIEHEELLLADKFSRTRIDVKVVSDVGYSPEQMVVRYFYEAGQDTITATFSDLGADRFSAILEPRQDQGLLHYYIEGLENEYGQYYRLPSDGSVFSVVLKEIVLLPTPFLLADGGDFENGSDEFISLSNNEDYRLWSLGTPSGKFDDRGSTAWVTLRDGSIGKPDQWTENTIVTPLFDLRMTEYDYLMSFDYLSESSGHDFLSVDYSLDTGRTWNKLGLANDGIGTNWYSKSDFGHFFQGETKDDNGVFEEVHSSYPLFQLAGHNCMFKFTHIARPDGSDSAYEVDGFLIDNFQIGKGNPAARFFSSGTEWLFPGDSVGFFYASSGADSFLWDFGDGSTSTAKNPVHSYESGGAYTVSLTITHPQGNEQLVKENYIKVIENKGIQYLLQDGGNFEVNADDFVAINVSGTPFERGKSEIAGKNGTSSGDFAWVTGLMETAYENQSEAYLYTPEFDFRILGTYRLFFKANYSFEGSWDGFIVEYTTDRGSTWEKLDDHVREGWYDAISDPNSVFGNSVPIFTGTTNGQFLQKESNVSFLTGENHVSFRFVFLTDAAVTDVGMALDDFELVGPQAGVMTLGFDSELASGHEGCEGVVYTFYNESTGSIKELNWFFGAEGLPQFATGVGPHEVVFPVAGSYDVVLNAIDFDDQVDSIDTVIIISPLHEPVITVDGRGGSAMLSVDEADAYQWFLDGNSLEGANDRTFLAHTTGNYSVAVTLGECQVKTDGVSVVTGLSAQDFGVTVFPNPTSRFLHIEIGERILDDLELRIIDISGRVVLTSQVPKGARENIVVEMPMESKAGLYLVEFSSNDRLHRTKFIFE